MCRGGAGRGGDPHDLGGGRRLRLSGSAAEVLAEDVSISA
jgi:hypothetical protein